MRKWLSVPWLDLNSMCMCVCMCAAAYIHLYWCSTLSALQARGQKVLYFCNKALFKHKECFSGRKKDLYNVPPTVKLGYLWSSFSLGKDLESLNNLVWAPDVPFNRCIKGALVTAVAKVSGYYCLHNINTITYIYKSSVSDVGVLENN